jgi:hypothetical protein
VREVVKDGYNGRLVFEENQKNFSEALAWCLKQSSGEFKIMKKNAQATTKEFAIDLCARRMLEIYRDVSRKEFAWSDHNNSAWDSVSDRLRNEWGMFKNMMHAGGAAMDPESSPKAPVRRTMGRFLDLPRLLSLSEWTTR